MVGVVVVNVSCTVHKKGNHRGNALHYNIHVVGVDDDMMTTFCVAATAVAVLVVSGTAASTMTV
jgi:hypothetical protein